MCFGATLLKSVIERLVSLWWEVLFCFVFVNSKQHLIQRNAWLLKVNEKEKELNNFCLTKYFPLPFISDSYLCVKIGGRFERAIDSAFKSPKQSNVWQFIVFRCLHAACYVFFRGISFIKPVCTIRKLTIVCDALKCLIRTIWQWILNMYLFLNVSKKGKGQTVLMI